LDEYYLANAGTSYQNECKKCLAERTRRNAQRKNSDDQQPKHVTAKVFREPDPILENRRIRLADAKALTTKYKRQYIVKDGSVYVITHSAFPGMVKIGWAGDPWARLGEYQMYAPTPYALEGYAHAPSIKAEKAVHRHFKHQRVSGEWFRVSVEEALAITKKICLEHSTHGRNS
jgi:hypothetical protein